MRCEDIRIDIGEKKGTIFAYVLLFAKGMTPVLLHLRGMMGDGKGLFVDG